MYLELHVFNLSDLISTMVLGLQRQFHRELRSVGKTFYLLMCLNVFIITIIIIFNFH